MVSFSQFHGLTDHSVCCEAVKDDSSEVPGLSFATLVLFSTFSFHKSESGWQRVLLVRVGIFSMQDAEVDISGGNDVMFDIEGAVTNGSSGSSETLEVKRHEIHG